MLHPDVEKLANLVEEWATIMRKYHGDCHWVSWLENDVRNLRNSDFCGVEHLLSAFGGMGSIADFALVRETGNWIAKLRRKRTNRRYAMLVGRVYELAKTLQREQYSENTRT